MDGHRLKILVHGLEKKLTHNQMLRAKYADNPAKCVAAAPATARPPLPASVTGPRSQVYGL